MRWFPIFLSLVMLAACSSLRVPSLIGPSSGLSQEELRAELASFASHFHRLVAQAADTIHASTSDPTVRKRTLLWKVEVIPLVEEAAVEPNPQEAFVSLLTLTAMMRRNLTEGQGGRLLGDQQSIALEVARELEAELLGIGARFLGDTENARVRQEVEQFVTSQPIASEGSGMQSIRRTLTRVESTGVFQRVVSVPLVPFRALEGVGDSAAEIRNFNDTARAFVRSMERLPEQIRWQVELLLYDVEERQTTSAALASLDAISQSASRASQAMASLPEDVRSLLEDSSATLERLQQLLASARELAEPLRATSEQIQQASASWASVLRREEGGRSEEPGRPFDVREWASTAHEIGATAGQLERLLQELRAASDARLADAALAPVNAALERVDGAARTWIDHAALRLAQVILAAFVLALAYRLAGTRIARR